MEARLYAEDPANGFLPSTGRLDHFALPERLARIDTGVEEGGSVTPYYDPMIAKLIVLGHDRPEAVERLGEACAGVEIWPVRTNAEFLARICLDEDFRAGRVDTGFIAARLDSLAPDPAPGPGVWQLAANSLLLAEWGGRTDTGDPWNDLAGFRAGAPDDLSVALSHRGETRILRPDGAAEHGFGRRATAHGGTLLVFWQGQAFAFTRPGAGGGTAAGAASDGILLSPMPGRVLAVEIRLGDAVSKGQKLVTLEAMKMEHSLVAPFDGIVAELNAKEGAQVSEGALLVRIEKGEGA